MSWIKDRLKEKSTYLAIFGILSSVFGIVFAPEARDSIVAVVVAIFGGTLFAVKTKKK